MLNEHLVQGGSRGFLGIENIVLTHVECEEKFWFYRSKDQVGRNRYLPTVYSTVLYLYKGTVKVSELVLWVPNFLSDQEPNFQHFQIQIRTRSRSNFLQKNHFLKPYFEQSVQVPKQIYLKNLEKMLRGVGIYQNKFQMKFIFYLLFGQYLMAIKMCGNHPLIFQFQFSFFLWRPRKLQTFSPVYLFACLTQKLVTDLFQNMTVQICTDFKSPLVNFSCS